MIFLCRVGYVCLLKIIVMLEVFIYDVLCIFCGKGKSSGVFYEVKFVELLLAIL